jgi:hypothetical protein
MAKPRPTGYEVRKSEKPFHGKFWKVTGYYQGKRKQHWFSTEKEARADASDRNRQLAQHGTSLQMSTFERADAVDARAILAPFNISLTDAARHYAAWAIARTASKPLDQFIAEFQKDFEKQVAIGKRRPGSLKAMKETFVKLRNRFGSISLAEITGTELQQWLDDMTLAERTKENHRSNARQIFNRAKKQDLITINPVEKIDTFGDDEDEEPHVLLWRPACASSSDAQGKIVVKPME